jgi:serine/threonine protein phosphatase PrpC
MTIGRTMPRTFYMGGTNLFPGGHADAIGRRPTMEDACASYGGFAGPGTQYYGLFDGHGGREVAVYCAENLHRIIAQNMAAGQPPGSAIRSAIYDINHQAISRWEYAGATAVIVVIANNTIYTANVGDSRVILIENGRARRLTFDHRATVPSEKRAILGRGGTVFLGRVNGVLMLSRAIGDAELARYISCDPYMTSNPLKDGLKLIIACDGVWDVMTDQMAADTYGRCRDPIEAARVIKADALKMGSTDNISVMCVDLRLIQEPTTADR